MGAALEQRTAIRVLGGIAQNGNDLTIGGPGDGAGHAGAGALCGLDDLLCRSIDQLDVVALKTDSDFLFDCHVAVPPQNVVYGQLDQSLHTVPGVSRLRIRKAGKPPRSFPGKKSSKDKRTLVLFAHGAGTYPFTVSNSFARFVDRTYSAEITRIGWAVRQPPASTHIVACTTCIAQALCSRQIFYHIPAYFASPFLKKIKLFSRVFGTPPYAPQLPYDTQALF